MEQTFRRMEEVQRELMQAAMRGFLGWGGGGGVESGGSGGERTKFRGFGRRGNEGEEV